MVGRGHEGLLDGPRRGPAQQVDRGAGLVVGAGGAGAAERLLADHGTGGLVVDVEVARGVPQRGVRLHVVPGVLSPIAKLRAGKDATSAMEDERKALAARLPGSATIDVRNLEGDASAIIADTSA